MLSSSSSSFSAPATTKPVDFVPFVALFPCAAATTTTAEWLLLWFLGWRMTFYNCYCCYNWSQYTFLPTTVTQQSINIDININQYRYRSININRAIRLWLSWLQEVDASRMFSRRFSFVCSWSTYPGTYEPPSGQCTMVRTAGTVPGGCIGSSERSGLIT
jgi:hypothetical protein